MRKNFLKLLAVIVFFSVLFFYGCRKTGSQDPEPNTHLVPVELARQVAIKFDPASFNAAGAAKSTAPHSDNTIKSELTMTDKTGKPALYVFNFTGKKGFVFVSADYSLRPVMAYVNNGEFSDRNMPDGLQDWINRTRENIEVVRKGLYDNSREGYTAWDRYIKNYKIDTKTLGKPVPPPDDPCNPMPPPSTYTKGPLLPVEWGQSCGYNDLCALNQNFNCWGCNTHPLTGCVATSMSMVMRYHQFPNGYNYAAMPAATGNVAVQEIMRDAGNSVSMAYGCNSSGAQGNTVVPALKNTFGYSSANRWTYSSTSYNQGYGRVKDNISSNWPVILQGQDANAGGHQWVCDGWQETTYPICSGGIISVTYLMFHMNWGWNDAGVTTNYNGWYAFDNWNIWGLNWNFQYNRYGITEIHP